MSVVNICQGCLSPNRKLSLIGRHGNLYQQLLLTESSDPPEILMFCWECIKMMDNIHTFREKITNAQKILESKYLLPCDSLSTLATVTKINDYTIVNYEYIKDTIPLEIEVVVKQEKSEYWEEDGTTDTKETEKIENDYIFKDEILKSENEEINFDDHYYIDDGNVKKENKRLSRKDKFGNNVPVKKDRRRRGVLKKKYRTIIMNDIPDKRKLYDKVKIDQKGLEGWLEKKKMQTNSKQFQCDRCFCGFSQQKFYDHHLAVRHAKRLGRYECDICGFRFPDMHKLAYHVGSHFVQFVCKLCKQAFCKRGEIYLHFTHGPHGRQRECRKCGLRFDCRRRSEFFDHYRKMHEQFICDYCGKKYVKKKSLVQHIVKRHTDHRCEICNVTFATQDTQQRHYKRKHVVEANEHNYCVECNMQFINSVQYNEHLKSSVKHRANPAIPCPECGKIYTKRINMTNHYDLVHLKKSKYHCELCDTYYLNGYRLRYHVKFFHEKRPKPKNKLCKYCGKGFSNNRILDNHIRTHTGERPFACAHCTAAFSQKQALNAHVKSAHK